MREAAYRAMLRHRLGAASLESYVSRCHRVEQAIGRDLDMLDLTDDGLASLSRRLAEGGIAPNPLHNCLTALRRYRELPDAR